MAKRYYQNKKDRKNESRGMKKYLKKEMYADKSMRNRMEYDDSGMIHEDRNAMANLPEQVVLKYWPATPYDNDQIPDTIRGIDVQMRDDLKHQKKGGYPEKY